MSYTIFHTVAIGYTISQEKNIIEKEVRTCNHDTDISKNFCSVCGEHIYETVEELILSPEKQYANFNVVEFGCSKHRFFAIGIVQPWKAAGLESPVIKKLPEQDYSLQLKTELEQYGISVHISNFGIYSITDS
jgi:hypothetical protein